MFDVSRPSRSLLAVICVILVVFFVPSDVAAQWTPLSFLSLPGVRARAASTYCPERDSFIIFSGTKKATDDSFTTLTDMWEYTFSDAQWKQILQVGTVPVGRSWASMNNVPSNITDSCNAIMYGGSFKQQESVEVYSASDELWFLNITGNQAVWSLLPVSNNGVSFRSQHRMVRRGSDFILVGGMRHTKPIVTAFSDMWKLTLGGFDTSGTRLPSNWTNILPTNSAQSWVTPRYSFSMGLLTGNTPADDKLVVFGGITVVSSAEDSVGDMAIYNFGSNTWDFPTGVKLERGSAMGMVYGTRFFSFAGKTLLRASNSPTRTLVYTSLLMTNLRGGPLTDNGGLTPACVLSDGSSGLWCDTFLGPNDVRPGVRFDYSFAQRGSQYLVYGGTFRDSLDDFWSVDVTASLGVIGIAPPDNFDLSNDLASTVYFMIAILSMMVICFMVFVVSLRRHRGRQPMFFAGPGAAANRPVGARPEFVAALPLKTFVLHKEPSTAVSNVDTETIQTVAVEKPDEGGPSKAEGQLEEDDLHNMCAICLTDYEDGESLRVLPCNHFFHPACVDQWLSNHNLCPMCKAVVDPEPVRVGAIPGQAPSAVQPLAGADTEMQVIAPDSSTAAPPANAENPTTEDVPPNQSATSMVERRRDQSESANV